MERRIPVTINMTLGLFFIALNFFCLFAVPILAQNSLWWFLLLVPLVLTTNTLWALIHEGIHSMFHANRGVNNFICRLMALSFGTEFFLARYGHLMHHRFNRTDVDLTDAYDPKTMSYFWASVGYYSRVCFGLYLTEIIVPILFLLPTKIVMLMAGHIIGEDSPRYTSAKTTILQPNNLNKIRTGAVALIIAWVAAFYLYGAYWWLLLIVSLLRGFMISFADNLPHYGTSTVDTKYAHNLSMPKCLQLMILNFNMHRVHHHFPNIPWVQLPEKFSVQNERFDMPYFKQGWQQWCGPIPVEELNAR